MFRQDTFLYLNNYSSRRGYPLSADSAFLFAFYQLRFIVHFPIRISVYIWTRFLEVPAPDICMDGCTLTHMHCTEIVKFVNYLLVDLGGLRIIE